MGQPTDHTPPAAIAPVAMICGQNPGVDVTGGHITYVQAHALAARAAGYSPQIFCAGADSTTEQTPFGPVHRIATPLRHLLLAPVFHRPVAAAVAHWLERCGHEPPHLIHGFGPWAAAAASACEMLARRGIEALPLGSAYTTFAYEWRVAVRGLRESEVAWREGLFFRGTYPWVRTVFTRVERSGLRRAELVLVNYDRVASLIYAAHGRSIAVRRIPYAAPMAFATDTVAPAPSADRVPRIVSVARHDPRKGLDVLLHALALLDVDRVAYRATLIGPGRLLDAHRRLASRLRLEDRVAIPGRVEEVLPYLQDADVFVLPSRQEGSGSLALLEALQTGTAVVASRIDGIPEDIEDGDTGLLVPPGDDRALADALRRLLVDPGLRDRLGARARALYLDRFTAARFSAAIGSIYDELRDRAGAK